MPNTELRSVTRPKAIDTAFLFSIAGIVLLSLGTVLNTLVDREQLAQFIRRTLSDTGRPYTEDDVLALVGPFRTAGGIGVALLALLLILVAFRMRAGRNWARLLLTGFTLLVMVNFGMDVSASGAALDLIWTLAAVACLVAAVIYLFRPESIRYFAERRARR